MDISKKVYLGDSVYVCCENGMLKLTTENGYGPSNTIFLEIQVYESLCNYFELLKNREMEKSEKE